MTEKRSTYLRLRDNIKNGVIGATLFAYNEQITCRVVVNIGLECLIVGIEFLKLHGVPQQVVQHFVELLYARPGDVDDMAKGGRHEDVLRGAMTIINGPIVRHTSIGDEVEGDAHDHGLDDVIEEKHLDHTLN